MGTPVAPPHNLTVLSIGHEASREPSGENDTAQTGPECPPRTATKGLQCDRTPLVTVILLGNLLEYV